MAALVGRSVGSAVVFSNEAESVGVKVARATVSREGVRAGSVLIRSVDSGCEVELLASVGVADGEADGETEGDAVGETSSAISVGASVVELVGTAVKGVTMVISVGGTPMGRRVLVAVCVRVVLDSDSPSFWLPSVKIMPKASAIAIAPTTITATTNSFCLSLRRISSPV